MGIRITDLPSATSITSIDVIPIVQNGDTKKATTQLVVQSLLPVSSTSQQGIVQLGTTAGMACDGADARLSNSRSPSGSAGGDLTGAYPTPSLTTSGVVAGTFGSPTEIPIFTVDSKGRVTSGTAAILTLSTSQIPVISPTQVGAGLTSAQITGISASQVGLGLTSAQIVGLSAAQIGTGITSAQIAGLSAAQVGTGLTSAQITGLNVTQVGSLGANVSTFLQVPSSANLAAALTDETGSGANVFATSPAIATPTINGYTEGTVIAGTVGASATLAITSGTVIRATLTSATPCIFTMPPVASGKSFVLYLSQPTAGSATSATFTGVKWSSGFVPTITPSLGKLDILSFTSDGVNWYGSYIQDFTY